MSKLLLGVNIDHVATLRNVRNVTYPDPIQAAFIAEQAGADSITVHLREDRRHIRDCDIKLLRKTIKSKMNLEIAATEDMVAIACSCLPHFCCLVPENRGEITTEGGLDVINQRNKLRSIISRLIDAGIQVSLFVNADKHQILASAEIGVSFIEINTGKYATVFNNNISYEIEFEQVIKAVQYATNLGLKVNAGHGLDYHNIKPIASILDIVEFNIGHSIISRAVMCGLTQAVRDMKNLLIEARYQK